MGVGGCGWVRVGAGGRGRQRRKGVERSGGRGEGVERSGGRRKGKATILVAIEIAVVVEIGVRVRPLPWVGKPIPALVVVEVGTRVPSGRIEGVVVGKVGVRALDVGVARRELVLLLMHHKGSGAPLLPGKIELVGHVVDYDVDQDVHTARVRRRRQRAEVVDGPHALV